MSGWMINIELAVDEVQDLLASLPGSRLTVAPDGFALAFFAEGVVAYGSKAHPECGTDLTVKGPSPAEPAWQLYRFLETQTSDDVVLWMMDDGSVLAAARGTSAEELGL